MNNLGKLLTRSILWMATLLTGAAGDYKLSPDSMPVEGVAKGRVEGPFVFDKSGVFDGTERHYWVYIPAGQDAKTELALMVFQDGHAYVTTDGQVRVPTVFDNLIASGDIPPMLGIFVNPGHKGDDELSGDGWKPRSNRSFEYDSLGDAYARFVIDELVPHVEEKLGVKVSTDPAKRAICGMSSGGICAWTVAWERPDSFGKVLSHIGSFTNIRGGHVYPDLIRKTDRKPIRVFLQDGSNDLNNTHGSWPLANQQMAASLAFAGYDFQFAFGNGAHNGEHGGAILPDSLRWLWRKKAGAEEDIETETSGWKLIGESYKFTDGACADDEGNVYFSDLPNGTIYKIEPDRKPNAWLTDGPRVSGMHVGSDGKIYAAVQGEGDNDEKKIIAIDPATRAWETIATRVSPNDLVVSKAGWIYFTDTGAGAVVKVDATAKNMSRPPTIAAGIAKPNGIALSETEDRLFVSEFGGQSVWSFRIGEDGNLTSGERLMTLASSEEGGPSGGDGMAAHPEGSIFVTSHVGIQVFDLDEGGKRSAMIAKPVPGKATVSCVVAKAGFYLYVCSADRVYRIEL
jgi:gluconolactonase